MTGFTVSSFNVKNLIGPDQEYCKFQSCTPEQYAWEEDWLADQIAPLNADVIGFREIFEQDTLRAPIAGFGRYGQDGSVGSLPGEDKRYRHRAIIDRLACRDFGQASLAFAPNIHHGRSGQRRPGVAILSRQGFAGNPQIITAEVPFKNHTWMLRHDAKHPADRYTETQAAQITEDIDAVRLHSAEKLFARKSLRDMVSTAAFGGRYESIDEIMLSRHFLPDWSEHIGQMSYFSVLNDHLTDGNHPEAPYNKLASDHGQIMATIDLEGDQT